MTELLSQDEIDSLLNAISSGESVEAPAAAGGGTGAGATAAPKAAGSGKQQKVKLYDFKRPDKFSKDQIRTLQMINESFARLVTTSLSSQLRTMVQVHVASVDQLTYEEFMKSIPNPTTIAIASMAPLEGNLVLEIDPSIAFTIIDRLFGGKGWSSNLARELTDIEQSVVERIVHRMLQNMSTAWENVLQLQLKLEKIECNPQFVQIVPPNDMVVLITLETKVGEVEGMTNLCIPYIVLEPIINKLSAQFWYAAVRRQTSKEHQKRMRSRMTEIEIPLVVEVGTVHATLREMLELSRGDVLKLEQRFGTPMRVQVNGEYKFTGVPGLSGSKKALKVVDFVQPSEEEMLAREQTLGTERGSTGGNAGGGDK